MKKMLHIIQNDPEVPPGNIIDNLSIPYIIHHPYRDDVLPALAEIRALIVLGGAMGANDDQRYPFLVALKQRIREVVAAGIPYLGICLGGQLLAAALGGKVVSNRWEELGTLSVGLTDAGNSDRLFSGVPETFTTFQWHHDSFDIPDGGIVLAYSAACPHQAFRVGSNAWGFQFHPEVTETIIRDWCAWDASTAAAEATMLAGFCAASAGYADVSRQIVHNFVSIAQTGQAAPGCSYP